MEWKYVRKKQEWIMEKWTQNEEEKVCGERAMRRGDDQNRLMCWKWKIMNRKNEYEMWHNENMAVWRRKTWNQRISEEWTWELYEMKGWKNGRENEDRMICERREGEKFGKLKQPAMKNKMNEIDRQPSGGGLRQCKNSEDRHAVMKPVSQRKLTKGKRRWWAQKWKKLIAATKIWEERR